MAPQTTLKTYVRIPDGCKVEIKASGDLVYTDLGVVMGAVDAVLNWTENRLEYANAVPDIKRKDMVIEGGFELGNLNSDNILKLSNGIITSSTVAGAPHAAIPTQTIAAGWADKKRYPLIMEATATDDTLLKMATAPAITTVKLAPIGANETLTAWSASASGDYTIVADTSSYSGWSIVFNSASMSTGSPTTLPIVITYAANTPLASTVLKCGTASMTATPYALRLSHTDDTIAVMDQLDLYSVFTQSGGLVFNFKPVTDTGIDTIPVKFKAENDRTLTDMNQLFSYTVNY